jgi:hypothetical protein
MLEIFGSAIPAVSDFESRLWIVKVAKSEGLGLTVQSSPCAALCKCNARWLLQPAERLGRELDLRYQSGPKSGERLAYGWRLSLTPTFGLLITTPFPQIKSYLSSTNKYSAL